MEADASGNPGCTPVPHCLQSKWHRVWSFISERWAPKVLERLKAFVWVTEYQEQDALHVHYLLRPNKTIDDLVRDNDSGNASKTIVCTAAQLTDPDLGSLVREHRIHRHYDAYCMRQRLDGSRYCRFGFPKPAQGQTQVGADDEMLYRGLPGDTMTSGHNPDILRVFMSNMDVQLNVGTRALTYTSKYISKPCAVHEGSIQEAGIANMNRPTPLHNQESFMKLEIQQHGTRATWAAMRL
ncbi:hypothetical protein BGZ72_008271 [Mortierella alpina]|nr:hypothetical protein BGZ72_008271 [Mortierella alpina]